MNSSFSRRNRPLALRSGAEEVGGDERWRREPLWENWTVPIVVDGSMLMGESEVLVMVAMVPQRVSRKDVEKDGFVDW